MISEIHSPTKNGVPIFKVAFLGDASVGKTSIVQRFYQETFDFSMDPTIGASFIHKDMDVDGSPVQLNIWDTAGQERYRSLVSAYTRGCDGAILTFSFENKASYENLTIWLNELLKQCMKNCVIYVCGNKTDLLEDRSEWKYDMEYKYFETSAKTGEGINELFEAMAKDLRKATQLKTEEPEAAEQQPVVKKENKEGCC